MDKQQSDEDEESSEDTDFMELVKEVLDENEEAYQEMGEL